MNRLVDLSSIRSADYSLGIREPNLEWADIPSVCFDLYALQAVRDFKLQNFLAERILGGDIVASSIAKLLRTLRSFTSSRLYSPSDSPCLELSTRCRARLT
jgi:hypothetical protein